MILPRISWIHVLIGVLMVLFVKGNICIAGPAVVLTPDMLAIQGRWVRADAPYVIELRYNTDNILQATYFNRRPIHVEKTETAEKGGLLYVVIRLQDVNYPGSTYLLSYDRGQDSLSGTYVLPASGQRYEVRFVRKIPQ